MTAPGQDGHPNPLPVMTVLLAAAVLAAVGIVLVARSRVPAAGWVLLVLGVLAALGGVVLAVRNVRTSRAVARRRDEG